MPKNNDETKVNKKTVSAKKEATSKLAIDVLDLNGKVVESLDLAKEIFGITPNQSLIAQSIRAYLANQRFGGAATKGRGEISGGGRKPWRQKGTGRARIGSIRAPHWRGGGVVFGPKPKDYSLVLPKKMKQKALISALSAKFQDKGLLVIKNLDLKVAKTKEASDIFKNLNIKDKALVVDAVINSKEKLAFRNLEVAKLTTVATLNSYLVLDNKKLLLTKEAIKKLEESLISKK